MKVMLMILAVVIANGCSSSAVRCDGRLTPINSPVPAPSIDRATGPEKEP